jgi:hypothetical protein
MIKIFLSLFFLLFSFSCLYAERYFVERHISENKYYDTLGYGIGELLESRKCPNCVEYNVEDVYGTNSGHIIDNINIYDVTTLDSNYGLIRLPSLYDRVSLPPCSGLDFIYWSVNTAQKDINISTLDVFLSRSVITYGDLRKVLYIDGEYKEIPITYIIWNYPRMGIAKEYPGLGIIKAGEGNINGTILDRVYVKSPLEFVKWEASVEDDYVLFNLYVRNNSSWELRNIVFSHFEYTNVRTYQPNEEHRYEYIINLEDEVNTFGYASLYNPNSQTQCAVFGENMESNYVGDSPAIAGLREENGQYLEYIGSRVKPMQESFCVTQIPYTLYSSEMILDSNEQEHEQEQGAFVEDSDSGNIEELGSVLGINKLPQTGVNEYPLLVVMSILWYYFTRRLVK